MKHFGIVISLSLLCTSAVAADLSGWYAGADIGAAKWQEKTKDQIITLASPAANVSNSLSSKLLGVHLGFNMPVAKLVLGIEARYATATGAATTTFPPEDFGYVLKPRWQAALDLRAGVVSGANLLYVTTGPSVSNNARTYFDHSNFYGSVADDRLEKTTRGWTFGAGIERELTERMSGRIEYRHSTFSRLSDYPSTFNHPTANPPDQYFESHTTNNDTVLIGLSFSL
jgi:outer membrane immunogenic protein